MWFAFISANALEVMVMVSQLYWCDSYFEPVTWSLMLKLVVKCFRNIDVNKNFAYNTLDHDGMVMVVFIAPLLKVAVDDDMGLESKPWTC